MAGNNTKKRSGFDVPAFGEVIPKGAKPIFNAEGLIVGHELPPGAKVKKTRETPAARKPAAKKK